MPRKPDAALTAIGMLRRDAALDWLLARIAEADAPTAAAAIDALAIYKHDPRVAERIAAAAEITERVVRDLDDGGRVLWIDDAKTEAGRRNVAVPEELRGYLAALAKGRPGEALLFGAHWRDWPRKNVQRICREAVVPKVSAHGMRGLAATLAGVQAVQDGAGLDAVAAALGHADPAVTETSYADRAALERARRRGRSRSLTAAGEPVGHALGEPARGDPGHLSWGSTNPGDQGDLDLAGLERGRRDLPLLTGAVRR